MRALRVSMYGPDLGMPVSLVMIESELNVTFEEAVAEQRILPGGYIVCDVFETEHENLVGATLEAAGRQAERAELEGHAALLYHWDAGALENCAEGGTLTATVPAPIDAETIIDCLEQLAHHPNYRGQLVIAISDDSQIITMRDGKAKIVPGGPE